MQKGFYKRLLVFTLLFVSICAGSYAQIDTTAYHQLKGVEVTGKSRPSVTKETTPLQVINKESIDRLGLQGLSEAVKRFSGATVQDYGGVGGLKTVSVRSLGAKHTAVSYDGVTITDTQSGQVDIGRFSLDNVDLISLSVGQADNIFQTARISASAGALNIETRKPSFEKHNSNIEARIKGGSFGMFNPSIRWEQKISDKYSFSVYGDWMRADGRYPYSYKNGDSTIHAKRSNSDISTWHTEANLFANWKKGGELQVKGYWFDSDRGLPGSIILYNDYHTERLNNKNGFAQAKYTNRLSEKLRIQALGKFDYSHTRHRDYHNRFENGVQTDVYTQREYYISTVAYYQPVERLSFSLAEDFFVNTLDATIPNCPFPERYTSLTSLSAQYSTSRLTATGSLLGTYSKEHLRIGESAPDKKRISPAVSLSYRLFADQNIRVRASYKENFRLPTFNDLYYDRFGNKDLKPEKATQYNLGATWSGDLEQINADYLSLTVDGYYNRVKDKIVAIPTMFIWKMMNMGKVAIGGVDVNFSSRFNILSEMALMVEASYTYQHAVDRTKKGSKIYGDQIPYTPRHSGNVALSWENPWVNVAWSVNAVGKRYSLPENIELNLIKKYTDQQIAVNRSFGWNKMNFRVQAEVLNLMNKQYDVIRYYPMPGRSFRASLMITY